MIYSIDASVFVASARVEESHHMDSLDFLDLVQEEPPEVYCPSIILAECSAALARRTHDTTLALKLVSITENFVGMQLIDISINRAQRAAQISAYQELRGADAIYVAIAEEYKATLVTWDKEMLQRAPALVKTITPTDWLAANTPSPSQP